VVFCDLRGFTAFSESAEPEDVMQVLREYHEALGLRITEAEGTLERFTGDGVMVFFNDPVEQDDHVGRALRMGLALRSDVAVLALRWGSLGHRLGFGVGIATGYATMGRIGFEGRVDYAAVGSVVNLAARLCGEAGDGSVLLSPRAYAKLGDRVTAADYVRATQAAHRLSRQMAAFHASADVLLTPGLATLPVKLGWIDMMMNDLEEYWRRVFTFSPFTVWFNLTGQPALVLPLGRSAEGLPVSVQLVARFGDEATLFRLGAQLEAARPWFDRKPALAA